MARCAAPVNGHRTTSGVASCPACSSHFRGYDSHSLYYLSKDSRNTLSSGGSGSRVKPRWSRSGSSVVYTSAHDLRDIFLCHAWDDRKGVAKELHDLLEAHGVLVWFSEKDVLLGASLLREIDRGLAKSRIGIVLVTPALLRRLAGEGIADKELSVLLARDLLIPIVHDTTYEALRDISPLLGSRSRLSTAEAPMADIAIKLAELVTL